MKVSELIRLNESTQESEESSDPFIHMENSMNTFGEFMKKFPTLDEVVKEIAMEYEWSKETFTKLKAAQIPEAYLYCKKSKLHASSEFVNADEPTVLANFTSVDEEVGYQADSMFHEPILLKIPSERLGKVDDWFMISINGTRSTYQHYDDKDAITRVIGSLYKDVNVTNYASQVKKLGIEYVLDNLYEFSQIHMLTVFSNEV